MRIDSFFLSLVLLLVSLLALLIGNNTAVFNIAYCTTLLSAALFTVDDWFDAFFIRLAKLLFALSRYRSATKQHYARIRKASSLVFHGPSRPIKARQRWLRTHAGRGIRRMKIHRNALWEVK